MIGRHLRRRAPLAIVLAAVAGLATQAVAMAGPVNEVDTPAVPFAADVAIPAAATVNTFGSGVAMTTAPTTNGYYFVKQLARTENATNTAATLTIANGADVRFAQAVTALDPGTNFFYVLVVTNPATGFQQLRGESATIPAAAPQSGQVPDQITVPTLTAADPITVTYSALWEATSAADPAVAIDEAGAASFVSIN